MNTIKTPTSKSLSRAIVASVAAMLAMNLFVLAQQLQPTAALAASDGAAAAAQA